MRSGAAWHLESVIQGGVFTYSHQDWKKDHYQLDQNDEDFYYNHRVFIERSRSNYVFVTGSQVIANIDISKMRQIHQDSSCDITLLYKTVAEEERPSSLIKLPSVTWNELNQVESVTVSGETVSSFEHSLSMNMFIGQIMTECI